MGFFALDWNHSGKCRVCRLPKYDGALVCPWCERHRNRHGLIWSPEQERQYRAEGVIVPPYAVLNDYAEQFYDAQAGHWQWVQADFAALYGPPRREDGGPPCSICPST